MRWTLLLVSGFAMILSCLALGRSPAPWEVKDSKGRVRMVLLEEGDAVQFALLAANGEQRITFAISESGLPSFALRGEKGIGGVSCRGLPGGEWGLFVDSDSGNSISLRAKQGKSALVARIGDNPASIELIAETGARSALSLRSPNGAHDDVLGIWCGREGASHSAGFVIGNPDKQAYRAGLVSGKGSGTMFLGVDKLQDGSVVAPMMMNCDRDTGSYLILPGQTGSSVALINQASRGVGLMTERQGKRRLLLGADSQSDFGLRVYDADGNPVLDIPEK